MFKRLNTGGSNLSEQEIRNVTARMIGDNGTKFYEFIQTCSTNIDYVACTETISESDIAKRLNEEFVIRFFAGVHSSHTFKGNLTEWLNSYMESILLGTVNFVYTEQHELFSKTFKALADSLGPSSFVRFKNGKPVGALAPAYFEAVSISVAHLVAQGNTPSIDKLQRIIPDALQDEQFKRFTGPGSSKKADLEGRVNFILAALS